MSNYNKVKNEGEREFDEQFNLHHYGEYGCAEMGYDHRDEVCEQLKAKNFLSTYAEKLDKARLEDVLEFVGEDEEVPSPINGPHSEIINHLEKQVTIHTRNQERQRIRDYIKTLTK